MSCACSVNDTKRLGPLPANARKLKISDADRASDGAPGRFNEVGSECIPAGSEKPEAKALIPAASGIPDLGGPPLDRRNACFACGSP